MKFHSLTIVETAPYGVKVDGLYGIVQFQGEEGKMEVRLSREKMASILDIVALEAQASAVAMGRQVSEATHNAVAPLVLPTAKKEEEDDIPF
jgi:hypothetical protein